MLVKEKRCKSCDGISLMLCKDCYVKIFECGFSFKDKVIMVQVGWKSCDVLIMINKNKKDVDGEDEGVVDMELELELEDEGEGDSFDEGGDVVMKDVEIEIQIKLKMKVLVFQCFFNLMEVKGCFDFFF